MALPTPSERERGQWYYQRYIAHLPSKGEIVLFDRSWYNRAGVEKVMGFCTSEEYYRFSYGRHRFSSRCSSTTASCSASTGSRSPTASSCAGSSPGIVIRVRRWKLSPMDLESINRWEDYSRAKDEMMVHTDTPSSPWFVVESDIKKHARLNMIAHLLSSISYAEVPPPDVELPKRLTSTSDYQRPPRENFTYVADYSATLLGDQES